MLYQPVTLSVDTLGTVWRKENLGELHTTLVDVPAWRDEDAIRAEMHAATGELAAQNLLGGRDLDPDFRDSLNLLARPSMEYYGWISYTDGETSTSLAVLVVASGSEALLAVRNGQTVQLQQTRADGMAETLVGHLPQVGPARGRSINLPEAEVRRLVADRMEAVPGGSKPLPANAYQIFGRDSMAEDAKDLLTVMDLPRTGGGELYVAARGRSGERRRCANPLVYVDTQQGRWMTQLTDGRAGERWIVSAPASRQLLLSKLNEMRNHVLN